MLFRSYNKDLGAMMASFKAVSIKHSHMSNNIFDTEMMQEREQKFGGRMDRDCGCGDGGGRCRAASKCFLLTLESSCRVCLFVSLVYLVFFFVR